MSPALRRGGVNPTKPASLLTLRAPSSSFYHVASQRSHVGFFSNQAPSPRRRLCNQTLRSGGTSAEPQAPPRGGRAARPGLQAGSRGPCRTGTCLRSFSTLSPTAQGASRPEGPAKARGDAGRREASQTEQIPNQEPQSITALN